VPPPTPPAGLKDWITLAKDIITALSILCAGGWFLWQGLQRNRTQVAIDCKFHKLEGPSTLVLAEVLLTFENKGYTQQHLQPFEIQIYALNAAARNTANPAPAKFDLPVLTTGLICAPPEDWTFFRIRPSVQQVITQTALIPADLDLVQIKVDFSKNLVADSLWVTPLERVFKIPKAPEPVS
jgi:hypothetical protein